MALLEQPGRWNEASVQTRARRSGAKGSGWVLDGGKRHVLDGHLADLILVGARTPGGLGMFAVDGTAPALTRVFAPTLDQTGKQAHLEFAGTPARLIGDEADGGPVLRRVLDTAAILLAAEQAGGALRVVEMAVDYPGMRALVGQPPGQRGQAALGHRVRRLDAAAADVGCVAAHVRDHAAARVAHQGHLARPGQRIP